MLVLTACAALTFSIQLSGFSVAYLLQTEKFYDILGGLNLLALAALSATASGAAHSWTEDPRKVASTVLFVCSRGWLLLFLTWRAHERQGDARFDGFKDKFGVFLFFWVAQAMWVLFVSAPMLFVNLSSAWQPQLTGFDWVTLAGYAAGVLLEAAADVQKAAWVRAGRPGAFCTSGLWGLSRHPNYFGEILTWWCAWAFAYSSGGGLTDAAWWLSAISPLFTMHVILQAWPTGLTQANGKNLKRYYDRCPEEYAEYRRSTSILVPMVGYKHVPMFLKRTVFLDFARYEYRPSGGADADAKQD